MTLEQFLIEFEKVAGQAKWIIRPSGTLRTDDGYCPICYLATKLGCNPSEHKSAGVSEVVERLKLDKSAASLIVDAADKHYNSRDFFPLREKLTSFTKPKTLLWRYCFS